MEKSNPVWKSSRRRFRPRLESLETRLTPSAYTVSSLADSGPGSLRAAITSVNGDNTADVIDFSVAGVIELTSGPLPDITNTVNIDGTSALVSPMRRSSKSTTTALQGSPSTRMRAVLLR